MNNDFERHLARQTIKPVPADWKQDILAAAHRARPEPAPTLSGAFRLFLHELLWPSPKAWAALAAVWVVMLTIGRVPGDEDFAAYAEAAPVSTEQSQLLWQQHAWVRDELLAADPPSARILAPRHFPPVPRTEQPAVRPQKRSESSAPIPYPTYALA